MISAVIRRAGPNDVRFLRDMLRHAFYWRARSGDEAFSVAQYVTNFGRPGDAGIIALDDGMPVGAAWYRLFKADQPGLGFVDEETPELAIAVVPARRGRGLGDELLTALLERARKEGFSALSLSVHNENPAIALYRRHGFDTVADDGDAQTMKVELAET
jgi:ribosomal protein S18 acetylase RimI-like enzyme